MSLPAAVPFFRNVLEDDDFRRFILSENGALDRNALYDRTADLRRAIINDEQHLFERDRFANFDGQPIDLDRFTFAGDVLLAARFHNSVLHFYFSPASLHHRPCELLPAYAE